MAIPVLLPPIATDTIDGTLVKWCVEAGATVKVEQIIAEVETAKLVFEVEAPEAGTLLDFAVEVGTDVTVGDTLAWIGKPGEKIPVDSGLKEEDSAPSDKSQDDAVYATPEEPHPVKTAPAVRRLAEKLAVDLGAVHGTGCGGRILKKDVVLAAEGSSSATSNKGSAGQMRAAVAALMSRAKSEIPHFYTDLQVDTSGRELEIQQYGFTTVLTHCVAQTLSAHPELNATYDASEGVVPGAGVNIGVAVALDEGVTVPVIHNADKLDPASLGQALEDCVAKARKGPLTRADVDGVTFTISNAGMTQVDTIIPIIHMPAIAILGVGSHALRPVVIDREVQVRPTVRMVLSCDHRAIDGMAAANWLVKLGRSLGGK